jgi:hypothetical protein
MKASHGFWTAAARATVTSMGKAAHHMNRHHGCRSLDTMSEPMVVTAQRQAALPVAPAFPERSKVMCLHSIGRSADRAASAGDRERAPAERRHCLPLDPRFARFAQRRQRDPSR